MLAGSSRNLCACKCGQNLWVTGTGKEVGIPANACLQQAVGGVSLQSAGGAMKSS